MKKAAWTVGALATIFLGFTWGYLAHRDGIFPYELARRLVRGYRPPDTRNIQGQAVAARQMIASLPYIDAAFDPESHRRGVLLHEPSRAQDGVNFYHLAKAPEARILNMQGEQLHGWSLSTRQWEHAEPLPNGDLIVVIKNQQILRLDRDSQLLWRRRVRVHHSVDVQPNGEIYAITRKTRLVPGVHPQTPVVDDDVAVFSAEGLLLREISVLDQLLASPFAMLLPRAELGRFASGSASDGAEIDLLHANHIQVLDGALLERSPIYARGNILLSLRNINTILILDAQAGGVAWAWGPSNLIRQHHPAMLDNGNILLFNNGFEESEVLELDPLSLRILWRFAPGPEFFSATRGGGQRLDNGNTLITESDRGYVHEVDPKGELVWQFANPAVDTAGKREIIWSMKRFAPGALPFLEIPEPVAEAPGSDR